MVLSQMFLLMIQPHHRDRLGIHVMIKTDGSPTDDVITFGDKGPRNTTSLSQSENFEDYEVSFKLCPLLNLEWHLTASGKSRKYILFGMKSSEIDFLHWHSHQS